MQIVLDESNGKYLPVTKQTYLEPVYDYIYSLPTWTTKDLKQDLKKIDDMILSYNILHCIDNPTYNEEIEKRMEQLELDIKVAVEDLVLSVPERFLINH